MAPQALHGQKHDLQAGRLVRERRADHAAAVGVGDGHGVPGPVPRERPDGVAGNPALLFCPLGGFGNAVLVAQHVVLEPVEPDGVRVHVVLVVGALRDPRVRDGQLQRRVGVGQHGDPLALVAGARVVEVGRYEERAQPQLFQEVGHAAGLLPAPAPRGGLEVAAPVQHRVAVLADVLVQVLLVHLHADRVHAPHVLGPPVPALPAVGLARLQRVAAAQLQHHGLAAVRSVDHLGLAVPVGLAQDGQGAVLVVDALDLGGNEGGGLVPRDALVLGHAAVARVALPLRVPIHALHRIQHAVLRIDALLVAQGQRREQRLVAGLEHLAARLDAPGPALLHARDVVVVQRADAQHLAVLHVDACRVGAARERGPRDAAIDRVAPRLRTHEHHPLSSLAPAGAARRTRPNAGPPWCAASLEAGMTAGRIIGTRAARRNQPDGITSFYDVWFMSLENTTGILNPACREGPAFRRARQLSAPSQGGRWPP